MTSSLYVCYQSILDPLTQTQVVAYLEGLTLAGHEIILLTFEPRLLLDHETRAARLRLDEKGITWYWLPYHKRPSVPATAWDIASGIVVGRQLIKRHRVRVLHARSHVPALMGLVLKRLTGIKLLFDLRGFLAEEYVDAGTWPADGALFRVTKRIERELVRQADAIIVLAQSARDALSCWYPAEVAHKPVQVIPCCVDLRHLARDVAVRPRPVGSDRVLAYVGKLGGTYPVQDMAAFVAAARETIPGLRWHIWTQSDPRILQSVLEQFDLIECVTIGQAAPGQLLHDLVGAHAGLCLYKRERSGIASSPTKIGDYLGAGLPVVCSAGVGDVDNLLAGSNSQRAPAVGVTVKKMALDAYRDVMPQLQMLMDDPTSPTRCRDTAEEQLDLERVGWVRYRETYDRLI